MKYAYDRTRAKQLVPLLEAISAEIAERTVQIELLEQHAAALREGSETESNRRELMDLQAELAIHHREVRLAKKELEHLGCAVDESFPARILIPGRDGNLERGFRWDAGDETVHRLPNTSVS